MKATMAILAGFVALIAVGCNTMPRTEGQRLDIKNESAAALDKARTTDPSLIKELNGAAGYVVFPTVGKGGLLAGGAWGRGILYEKNKPEGFCTILQGTLGLQAGGQAYTEIVVFKSKEALADFKAGHFTFDAQATAVALRSGAGANAKYAKGVAVFTFDEAGLMAEAAVGGQKFSYEPMTP
jgi:lipid-binding SYLF domain-containing protein